MDTLLICRCGKSPEILWEEQYNRMKEVLYIICEDCGVRTEGTSYVINSGPSYNVAKRVEANKWNSFLTNQNTGING